MKQLYTPSTDFRAVRDQRTAPDFYFDIDLTTARSASAGTAIIVNVAGNSFYCDANPIDGNAVVHFQDTSLDRVSTPFYISPGFIAGLPFTQLLFENAAQPGKKIRIVYGVDVDFQPGSVSQISVSNAGGYTAVRPESQTGFFSDNSTLVSAVAVPVFLPSANINGAVILSAEISEFSASNLLLGFISKASTPGTIFDGSVIMMALPTGSVGTNILYIGRLSKEQYLAPGQGLYLISNAPIVAGGMTMHAARYKLL